MVKSKPNLAAALAKTHEEEAPAEVSPEPQAKKAAQPVERAASRTDLVNISGWFPKAVKFTLDELRLKRQRELGRRVTSQELMGEAYNELFKKYGMPEVAPIKEE